MPGYTFHRFVLFFFECAFRHRLFTLHWRVLISYRRLRIVNLLTVYRVLLYVSRQEA